VELMLAWSAGSGRGQGAVFMSVATDQTLVCRDCGREFIFTAGEQVF
jgi:hypothetical protein